VLTTASWHLGAVHLPELELHVVEVVAELVSVPHEVEVEGEVVEAEVEVEVEVRAPSLTVVAVQK